MYWGDFSSPNLKSPPQISLTADTWVTEEEWARIIAGGNGSLNALEYIKGLPIRTKEDLIRLQGGSQNGNQNETAVIPAPQGVQGTSDNGSSFANGSIGDSGPAVSAATITETTSQVAGSQQGNAYEVSKATPKSADDGISTALIILGAVIIGGLLALGFFKSSIFGFIK